jgi:lipoprotein LprG
VRTRLLLAIAAVLVLAGCGGSDGKKTDTSELGQRLHAARKTIDAAKTIDISLTTKSLPDGVTGLQSAIGQGNHSPAFKGKVKVVSGGSTIGADVVSGGGTVKAKMSFSPIYLKIDPASLKAPDPAALLDRDDGVTQILDKTKGLKDGGKSRDGSDVLTTIGGTLPGSLVRTIIPSADAGATFTVKYRLTDDDVLRDASLTGPFYPDAGKVTYTVKLKTSDQPVTIKVP